MSRHKLLSLYLVYFFLSACITGCTPQSSHEAVAPLADPAASQSRQQLASAAQKLQQQGQLDRALSTWQQAWQAGQTFGEKDMSNLHQLAQLEYNLAKYEQAEAHYRKLVAIKEKYFKGDYAGIPWNLMELGDALYRQKKYAEAAENYAKASQLFHKHGRLLGKVPAMRKQAFSQFKLGKVKDAIETYYQALATAMFLQANPETAYLTDIAHEEVGQMNADRATLAASGKAHKMAFKCASQAQSVWGRLVDHTYETDKAMASGTRLSQIIDSAGKPPGPPATYLCEAAPVVVDLLERMAIYYCHLGKYSEAEFLWSRTIEVFDDVSTYNPKLAQKRAEYVGQVYRNWYNCQQASAPYLRTDDANCDPKIAAVENPYLKEFALIKSREEFFEKYLELTQRFSRAVPTCQALTAIKAYQPLVEVGAGNCYWASLLKKAGVDIVAYDANPVTTPGNHSWTEVRKGNETALKEHQDRTLFVCWPPHSKPLASDALSAYQGNCLIYIGEGSGGCNGDQKFFEQLQKDWKEIKFIHLPQWADYHDNLYVYERKQHSSIPSQNGGAQK